MFSPHDYTQYPIITDMTEPPHQILGHCSTFEGGGRDCNVALTCPIIVSGSR